MMGKLLNDSAITIDQETEEQIAERSPHKVGDKLCSEIVSSFLEEDLIL